jgi:cytochrome c oxidase subunit 2
VLYSEAAMLSRRPGLVVLVASLVATAVGIIIALAIDWFPTDASASGHEIDTLYDVLMIVSVAIFVLVMAAVAYSIIRWRAHPGDMSDGEPIHGSTKLEIAWVAVPFLIVSILAGYGWIVFDNIEESKADEMVVKVTGRQFAWSFEYPDNGKVKSAQLVLPKDKPILFKVNTDDVIHDFWVPQFRLKTDAVPGLTTNIRVTPNRLGRYDVVCAELCGIGHSTMRGAVRVVTPAAFDKWVEARGTRAATGGSAGGDGGGAAGADAGKQIFNDTGCNACHSLADADANGSIGPNLDDLATAAAKFGKQENLTAEEYVKQSIEEPGAFTVPGFGKDIMPSDYKSQLSGPEIDALVKYLLAVSGGKK